MNNEKIFQILVEKQSLVGVYLFTEKYFLYVNDTLARIFGYKKEELIRKKGPIDLTHPDDRPLVRQNIHKRISGEIEAIRYIFKGIRKDGTMIYCMAFGQRTIYKGHAAVIGMLIDITENIKRQERAKRLYTLLYAIRDISELIAREEDKEILIKKSCERLFKTHIYHGVWVALQDEKKLKMAIEGKVFKPLAKTIEENKPPLCIQRLFKHSKIAVTITEDDCKKCPLAKTCDRENFIIIRLEHKKNIYGWLAVCFGNTLDKEENALLEELAKDIAFALYNIEQEKIIKENEQFLQNIFDGIQDGISILDRDFNVIRVNKWMEMMYATEMPLVGRKCYEIYQKRQSPCPSCPSILSIRTGKPHVSIVPYPSFANPVRWIELSSFPLRDIDGEIIGVIEHVKDITRRKKAEEEKEKLQTQLLHAQKMEAIGTLAGGIAHDLNNLLTPIIGYSELLLFQTQEPVKEKIESIKRAAEKAASLTRQLLAFSRKQIFRPKLLDLNALVIDAKKMLERLIGENIQLITKLEPELKIINADESQIEQVLVNLIVNARDAMPEGGEIIIETSNVELDKQYCRLHHEAHPGQFVCLTVKDTGIGMDEKTKQRIFEPFFTTKGTKGSGLGLAVTHGIIKQHKGWIEVYSERNKGSTFKIYLPVSEEGKKFISVKERDFLLEELQGQGERILLVEDNEAIRKFAMDILVKNGYTVFGARNAKEALDIFEREKGNFHLIFTDIVLPDKSGLMLIELLLLHKPQLKVLLTSGYIDKVDWTTVREKGFYFLQKPYSMINLLKNVKKAIS
ncbi:MAG TPA: PAS domain S-box protein [Candidatus Desulfofervidus auxilii]|uniref:histidine kinase n=1 Tax=Desulfofervidus auxilii TaxID=1621989 RepID=A0A7V0NEC6_DESA2|nr:PAS domain S-box protein [Candidatus Desulfofervidus auxilii]